MAQRILDRMRARQRAQRDRGEVPESERWNHSIHYFPHLLELLPAERVLEVGCGDGILARQLAAGAGSVTGIDLDADCIGMARAASGPPNVEYVQGDAMSHPFDRGSFDLVVSVAALHHLDTRAALERFRDLTAPGGRIGVIGLARPRGLRDLYWEASGAIATRVLQRRHRLWAQPGPIVWPPPHTIAEVREIAQEVLPGCDLRRRILWRFTLTWEKPAKGAGAG